MSITPPVDLIWGEDEWDEQQNGHALIPPAENLARILSCPDFCRNGPLPSSNKSWWHHCLPFLSSFNLCHNGIDFQLGAVDFEQNQAELWKHTLSSILKQAFFVVKKCF